MATKMNLCPLIAFDLIAPMTSNPHISKGHGKVILNNNARGAFILSPCLKLVTFSDIVYTVLSIINQKYPDLCIFLAIVCSLA
jgi:hypothetical protein